MSRKYRIVHLITRLDLGGAQQNTLFCVGHHDRRRFEVELIAGAGGILDGEAAAIPDVRTTIVPYLEHAIAPWADLRALWHLAAYFRARRPHLVHTHCSKAGVIGRLAARLAGVPVVVHTAHGWSFNRTQSKRKRRAFTLLERCCAPLADRLLMVSRRNREEGLALGIGRSGQYRILRSGIDVGECSRPKLPREAVRATLGVEAHHLLVGTVACLKPQKAPLDFVRAAAKAYARCDRLRFVMVGDGEMRDAVDGLIGGLGLEGVILPIGWRRDVTDLLHAMDLFLLTSHHEGLPRAVLQAMAAGLPVVATAVDGTPEVVRDGETGLLVPPERPELAAEALLRLAEDRQLRAACAERARRGLSPEFDIHRMVDELDGLYISLLEEG